MLSKNFLALITLAVTFGLVSAIPSAAPQQPCAAVHIIAARGSVERPGPGIIGALVTQIQNANSQTVSTEAVDYPATLTQYPSSSAQGMAATMILLQNQVKTCPEQKLVLVGYSQVSDL